MSIFTCINNSPEFNLSSQSYQLKTSRTSANNSCLASQITIPKVAWFSIYEFRGKPMCEPYANTWTEQQSRPTHVIKRIRQGYYACISYVDELIGKLLTKLKTNGFWDNTIVAFLGDHGYHLGEQSIFGKNTAFEVAANAPLMFSVPGVTDKGMISDNLVEFVDVFPTLVELAGFPKLPYCPQSNSRSIDVCTEGSSLLPFLRNTLPEDYEWKEYVFYQYPNRYPESNRRCIGYTIRTARYRYTEWTHYLSKQSGYSFKGETEVCDVELYDHLEDPNETINIAEDHALRDKISQLREKLHQGWSQALPSAAA